MREWDDAPVTKAALWASRGEQCPSALEREWSSILRHPKDVIFLSAGAFEYAGRPHSWTALWWHVGDESAPESSLPPALRTAPASVERLLSPLAHEARIGLMQAMYSGAKSAAELTAATGLKGGNLYYHLKELMHAVYVEEQAGGYKLTPLGCQMLITVASIAEVVVKDRGEEGLLMTTDWHE